MTITVTADNFVTEWNAWDGPRVAGTTDYEEAAALRRGLVADGWTLHSSRGGWHRYIKKAR